jgi:hypothetical protein
MQGYLIFDWESLVVHRYLLGSSGKDEFLTQLILEIWLLYLPTRDSEHESVIARKEFFERGVYNPAQLFDPDDARQQLASDLASVD